MMAKTSMMSATHVLLLGLQLLAACVQARPFSHDHSRAPSRIRPWNILDAVYHNNSPGARMSRLSVAGIAYYVQLERGGPELQMLIPPINTTTLNNFGLTQIFALNVTAEEDPASTQLGYVRGFTMQGSYTSVGAGVEVEVLSYNDGTLNGTVSIQGLVVNGPTEVAVVGGTGDFRGVQGYGNITLVNATDTRVVFHHDLHFV